MRVPYVCFIGRFLATTLHRAPTPWTRLHIDFVLPSLDSPVGDKFVEEVGGCAALVHADFVEWLGRLHPDTEVVEDKYRLTWAFVEKVVCEGCKGVTAGQQGAA